MKRWRHHVQCSSELLLDHHVPWLSYQLFLTMFQIGLSFNNLLSQASSALSTCQSHLAGSRLTRHRPTSSFSPSDTSSFNNKQAVRDTQEFSAETSGSLPTLRDLGLQYLPKDWQELLALQLDSNEGRSDRRSHWKVSYVSAESFFENKHGQF